MARNRDKNSGSEESAATETSSTEAKVDNRYKKVRNPDTGEEMNRADYIRLCVTPVSEGGKGMSRSEATKHLREVTGDPNLRYQIIFAATKGMKNIKASDRGKPGETTTEAAGSEAAAE